MWWTVSIYILPCFASFLSVLYRDLWTIAWKKEMRGFFVLFVHFWVSRSKFHGFKRKKQQENRSKVAQVKEVSAFTFAQRFFFFPIPDVLAAQIIHLGKQCNKKLWRVKTIDFKESYMQSENGSNSSNSTSHSAEWIKGRRVHYIHYWHFEGPFFFQGSCKGVNGTEKNYNCMKK